MLHPPQPPPPLPFMIITQNEWWIIMNIFNIVLVKKHIWLSNDSKNIQEYLGLMLHPPQPLPLPPAPIYDNHAEWMMNNYEYFQYSTSKKHMVKQWFQKYTIRIF